ncbi:AHH domain-containing protein [Cystobacter fuscus]|uniref:AHH domain-containing protein n=1 Tax=Cystobacter fuscus TaxID=43 RepID=UPI0022B76192|nr:AHH domain-containing protein [Cystobacter fuscus]
MSPHHGEPGEGLKLIFASLKPNPALALFSLEDARAVVAALEGGFKEAKPGPRPLAAVAMGALTAGMAGGSPGTRLPDFERRVREEHEELYGPALLTLPPSLESARWFQALKLSPRYMGEGVREAAVEMFNSPAVAFSVGMSMMLYMVAWAAPEPLFSKAFAAAVTLGLLMTYTATELYNVGMACLTLYREAEAARTQAQLEAVAERFGKALGGVGLRVLVTVAGAKLARGLPEVPRGGLWGRLSPPRFAFAGGRSGFSVGTGARAQVSVANGTVVLMGVSANTTASAAASAVSSARTTGACAESKKDDNHAHHLCTNKNDKSESNGGPWTPVFEGLFRQAGMSLDDPANIVFLRDHKGPHPMEYHRDVADRLRDVLKGCRTQVACRARLVRMLDEIAGEVCTPGSKLNKLVTRTQ